MEPIQITLNGEMRTVETETDLRHLLKVFSLPEKRVAIELNGEVVTRSAWASTQIRNGDRLEVVHFVGGG